MPKKHYVLPKPITKYVDAAVQFNIACVTGTNVHQEKEAKKFKAARNSLEKWLKANDKKLDTLQKQANSEAVRKYIEFGGV